jgi:hypothetical protein
MSALPEFVQAKLLAHAIKRLRVHEPNRIVIDSVGTWDTGQRGLELRIIFEAPGVLRVYDRNRGDLLAESEPGFLEIPVRAID